MKLLDKWLKWKTKNFTRIPLLGIEFNWQKYQKDGAKGSCDVFFLHHELYEDEVLKEKIFAVIDHIRTNYDMEKFTHI